MYGLFPSGADSFFFLKCSSTWISCKLCLPGTAVAVLSMTELDAALTFSKMIFRIYACVKFLCMLQYLGSKHKLYYMEMIPCTSPNTEESGIELAGRMHSHSQQCFLLSFTWLLWFACLELSRAWGQEKVLCQLQGDTALVSMTAVLSKWRSELNQQIASDLERQEI